MLLIGRGPHPLSSGSSAPICLLVSAGLLVLENLPCEAVAEAAVAAALLLEHLPQAVSILLRPGALNSLVDAALEEVASPGSDATLGVTLPCCLWCLSTRCF